MSYQRLSLLAVAAVLMCWGIVSTVIAEEEASGDAVETLLGPTPSYTLLWNGPRSLDTLVDERRDALRDRREAFHDSMRMFHGIYSPWMDHERDVWQAYSDQRRDMYRAYRDAVKFNHDQFRGYFMPWNQAFTKAAEARCFALAMDNLERQEAMDEFRYSYEPLFGAPYPW